MNCLFKPLIRLALGAAILLVGSLSVEGASFGDSSISFFTNLAERLLQSQFGLSLTGIQIYPTNCYSPAVHRILQISANIYDTSTNSPPSTGQLAVPSVFRPLFCTNASTLFICGYTNDNDAAMARAWFASSPPDIPLVIGAKKGLPNFNEFVFQTALEFVRKLEVTRPATNSPPSQTNQVLLLSVSNVIGAEIWNSYSRPFSNDFQVFASNVFSLTLSNAANGFTTNFPAFTAGSDFPVFASTNTNWYFKPTPMGITKTFQDGGYFLPLYTNILALPNSRDTGAGFDSLTNSFAPRTGQLPVPDWRLILSNRLTYIMSAGGAVLDAVGLSFQTNLNLTEFLLRQNTDFSEIDPATGTTLAGLWDTNRISASATLSTPTQGIMKQLRISTGLEAVSTTFWNGFNYDTKDKTSSIQSFKDFLNPALTSRNLYQQAPFTAGRRFVHTITWQANDPLIHYLSEDLKDYTNHATLRYLKRTDLDVFTNNLGRLNRRYRPWLGSPLQDTDETEAYVGTKDPGRFQSDDWDFPTNLMANPGLLGRVHRGTPWQTIYLKAAAATPQQWIRQSSDFHTHPTNDWRIASVFLSLWNTNRPQDLFSVNQSSESAWAGLLNGMTVLSNTTPTISREANTNFDYVLLQSNSPQAQIITAAINRTRASRYPPYFRVVADILATTELTTASPWLDLTGDGQLDYGLTDEAYEKIPEQLLSLLRADPVVSLDWVDGYLRVRATVIPGYSYSIEGSSDLQTWATLATRFADTALLEFPDILPANTVQAFYRLRLLEQP